jgi:hypothetical protein
MIELLANVDGLWLATHFNHPAELTVESTALLKKIVACGIPVINQSVLLKGVNDNHEILEKLFRELVKLREKPHYLFHVDPVRGVRHFATGIECGLEILRHFRKNLSSLATVIPADKRGVIYTPHVTQMRSIRDQLQKRGINAVGFWSENNFIHEMNDEEWAIRDSVILKGIIPDHVQVLLINAASETGINITSPVDYIVVNDSNPDTQIQAVGRVRHDVDAVYLRDYNSQNYTYISHNRLAAKWIDRRLYEEDKKLLCEELNIRDARGRLYKWPNIKKSLRFSDFRVTDKQEKNGRRYSIIEW